MQGLIKVIDVFNKALRVFLAVLLAAMTAIIAYQVAIRFMAPYLNMELPRWTEELARYLMIWLVFIGAALAVRYSALIGVEAIAERLKGNLHKGLKIVVSLISMFFFCLLIYYGFTILGHVSHQFSPGLKLPMTIPYAAIPVGGFFMLINAIAVLLETLHGENKKEFFQGAE